jgi:hypothetical protein
MNELSESLKIAEIHVKRILEALSRIQCLIPFDNKRVSDIDVEDLVWIELLVSRFGKLQDLLGKTIINAFLISVEEFSETSTLLDRINQLERMHIVESTQLWKDMRKVRNHIAHEYPDEPDLTAKCLNEIVTLTPKLIEIFENIKKRL